MRVSRLYESNQKPVISLEFFPPRNEAAEEKFGSIVDDLSLLKPDYMSVTFGAGGSNRDGSYQTVKKMMDKNISTVAYIAGYGLSTEDITEILDKYKDLGVETIFVIRGDKPRDDNFTSHPDSFSYASEMIAFIKEHYNFTLGCAGYPEGHIEAVSLEKDIEFLKLKAEKGAEYVVAQYFYDNTYFFKYVEKCRAAGIKIPIIPGIMPVYTVKMTNMLAKVCGTTITDKLKHKLDEVDSNDKDAVLNLGIDFATEQCAELIREGVAGLHFYTMNRTKSTTEIINRLKQENLL